MAIDILKERGTPPEKQEFDWKDLVQVPYSKLDDDAFTRVRVILMNGIETEAVRFGHACARMNAELQLPLARVRRAEHHQQTLVNWLNPPDQSVLIDKWEASEPLPGGPQLAELEEIRSEELAHFGIVRDAMASLGGDPTAVTPSADITSVSSVGLLQVVTDARTSLKQSLEAMLVAELVDNDGWTLLVELTKLAGHDEMAKRFEEASAREEEHLAKVRNWVTKAATAAAKPPVEHEA